MSITVPENVKPSGGLVKPILSAIPTQPMAASVESLKPRTWSFVSNVNGELLTVTCPDWCELSHDNDRETPTNPVDIWCQRTSEPVHLPVNVNGTPEEFRILSATLNVRPFDGRMSHRIPTVCVEVVDDHWMEDMDPDALEDVIGTLEARVAALRETHAQLVAARAAYRKQAQA